VWRTVDEDASTPAGRTLHSRLVRGNARSETHEKLNALSAPLRYVKIGQTQKWKMWKNGNRFHHRFDALN